MTGLRSLLTPADAATWFGRALGLLMVLFFGWVTWQALPMLAGDLLSLAEVWPW